MNEIKIGQSDLDRFEGKYGVKVYLQRFLDMLMFEGLEHHISLVYGSYLNALEAFAKLVGVPVLIMSEEVRYKEKNK